MSMDQQVVNAILAPHTRRWTNGRALLTFLLLIQFVFVGIGLVKVEARPTIENPRFRLLPVTKAQLPLTPETGLAYAQQYAAEWEPDSRLVGVSMHLDWANQDSGNATDLPVDGSILYLFVSGDTLLSLYLDRGSGNQSGAIESAQGGDVWTTLDLSTFQKSSTIAGLTADLLSGHEYREACPDQRRSSKITAGELPNADGSVSPVWIATYEDDKQGDKVDNVVRMDAVTGNVVENTNRSELRRQGKLVGHHSCSPASRS